MTVRSGAGTNMSAAARQGQLQQYPGHPAPQSGLQLDRRVLLSVLLRVNGPVGAVLYCTYCTVLYVVFVYLEKHNVPWSGSVTSHVPSAVRSRTLGFRGDEGRAGFLHVPAVVCAQSDSAPYSSKMQRARGRAELAGHLPCVVPLSGSVEANHQREMPCEKGSIPRFPWRRTVQYIPRTVSSSCWAFVLPTACPPPGVLLAVAAPHVFQHEGGPRPADCTRSSREGLRPHGAPAQSLGESAGLAGFRNLFR
jgi:hypothetical protein